MHKWYQDMSIFFKVFNAQKKFICLICSQNDSIDFVINEVIYQKFENHQSDSASVQTQNKSVELRA